MVACRVSVACGSADEMTLIFLSISCSIGRTLWLIQRLKSISVLSISAKYFSNTLVSLYFLIVSKPIIIPLPKLLTMLKLSLMVTTTPACSKLTTSIILLLQLAFPSKGVDSEIVFY